MSNVYFSKVRNGTSPEEAGAIARKLLETLVEKESISLEKDVPMKVHFGEPGNVTYISPKAYDGIISFLKGKQIRTQYMETSVLYGGKRSKKSLHLETARQHGFTQVPVVIADGDHGEAFSDIEVNLKHFDKCKIGAAFSEYSQILVVSHFKGHTLAGFGGAIKQLAMGHASKGGKLAMHMGIKPKIKERKCIKCGLCVKNCNENAITIGEKSFIDHEKCVGCGACLAVCPNKAVTIMTLKGAARFITGGNDFREKIAEYALAAQKGKRNIYINFAMNITSSCDCVGKKLKPVMDDFGVFASTDPVAIDKACLDMSRKNGRKFRGTKVLDYAEEIGLGSQDYEILEI